MRLSAPRVQQLIDLVYTLGRYNPLLMALNSPGVQPDAGLPGFDF